MSDQSKPHVAQKSPYVMEMEPGEYWWCACGHSKNQPFCDGSHKGSEIKPVKHVIEAKCKMAWCGCKQSKKGCYCDGTHKSID